MSKPLRVVVAGDSPEIIDACKVHGVEAVLTRNDVCRLLGTA